MQTYNPDLIAEYTEMRPLGGYDLVCADPPWHFAVRNEETGGGKSAQAHYDTMSLEDIKAMPVSILAADDSVLVLWCTHPNIPQALEVMEAWGYTYKTSGIWSKRNPETGKLSFGTGYLLRCASEPFLVGTRGKPKVTRSTRTVIEGKRREHSRKPDESFKAFEDWMPNARRLELFSRQSRPGWDNWGFEKHKFNSERKDNGNTSTSAPALQRGDEVHGGIGHGIDQRDSAPIFDWLQSSGGFD